MSDADRSPTDGSTARTGGAGLPPKAVLVLAIIFSATAAGSLMLVAVDLVIGRPAAGDVYVAGLNVVVAAVFWVWRARRQ